MMYGRHYKLSVPSNPVAQVLALLVFGAALIGAVFVGALILSALLGVAAVAGAVIAVRLWWFRRQLRKAAEEGDRIHGSRGQNGGRLIDAEYTVVERKTRRR